MKIYRLIIAPIAFIVLLNALPAHAADISSKIAETKDAVQQLLKLKDDTTLSTEEKDRLELQLKKTILMGTIDAAALQLDESRKQLDGITFPESEDWDSVKEYLYDSLDEYKALYKSAEDSIASDNNLTADKIKETAKQIEDKKTGEIDIFLKKVADVSATFSISDILKLADERLKKVSSDVDKIYSQKLTDNGKLKDSLRKASQEIGAARTLNNQSKEIMLHTYAKEIPASDTFIKTFLQDVKVFVQEQATTGSSSPMFENSLSQQESFTQDVIKQSAEHVRDAYDIFLQMSLGVKELIKE